MNYFTNMTVLISVIIGNTMRDLYVIKLIGIICFVVILITK